MRLRHLAVVAACISVAACTDGVGLVGSVLFEGADTVVVIERADLSDGGAKPEEAPQGPVAVGPFLLQPSTTPRDTGAATPPMSVSFSVRVSNTSDTTTPLHLEFGSCALGLGVYRDPDRTELAARWYWADVCPDYLVLASLAPGDSLTAKEFSAGFGPARLTRREKLTSGRYYLSVEFGVNWRIYTLPAGLVHLF